MNRFVIEVGGEKSHVKKLKQDLMSFLNQEKEPVVVNVPRLTSSGKYAIQIGFINDPTMLKQKPRRYKP